VGRASYPCGRAQGLLSLAQENEQGHRDLLVAGGCPGSPEERAGIASSQQLLPPSQGAIPARAIDQDCPDSERPPRIRREMRHPLPSGRNRSLSRFAGKLATGALMLCRQNTHSDLQLVNLPSERPAKFPSPAVQLHPRYLPMITAPLKLHS
jgi:hypothetical protein